MLLGCVQHELDVNALDDQHAVIATLNVPANLATQLSVRRDLARYQRATIGAGQSTGDRGDQIIDRRGVRFPEIIRIHAVVFGDSAMNAEYHRLRLANDVCVANRSLASHDPGAGDVGVTHELPPPSMVHQRAPQINPSPLTVP